MRQNDNQYEFNVHSDTRGGDPDSISPTLKNHHRILWSKPLRSGEIFELITNKKRAHLYHDYKLGEFNLGRF